MLNQDELLVSFLHGGSAACSSFGISDWFSLLDSLKSHGLLLVFADDICRYAPVQILRKLEMERQCQLDAIRHRLIALSRFADMAAKEGLHFVLLKGMTASVRLYGSEYIRQSGDIDILVAHDDIGKADCVARRAGWIEPGEAHRVRAMRFADVTSGLLHGMEAPYPLRSNPFLPHITNYYFVHDDGWVDTLEVHDRLPCVTFEQAGELLWCVQEVKLGGRGYLALRDEMAMLVAALSLHEDAEGVRANTSLRGDLGLKTAVDVHRWLHLLIESNCAYSFADIVDAFDVTREVSVVMQDMCELFPDDAHFAYELFDTLPSCWSLSYLERVFDPALRAQNGVEVVEKALLEHAAAADATWQELRSADGYVTTSFKGRVVDSDSSVAVSWLIPQCLSDWLESIVLQAVVVESGFERGGTRVNVFLENGEWRALAFDAGVNSVDGHAGTRRGGEPLDAKAHRCSDGNVCVTISVPQFHANRGTRVLCSVHERVCGSLYRRCAGDDLVSATEYILHSGNQGIGKVF